MQKRYTENGPPFYPNHAKKKMNSEQLKTTVMQTLEDLKAIKLLALNTRALTNLTDYMLICTGRSSQHVKSLAEAVIKTAKSIPVSYINTEGAREGEWVIVDLGDIVVHIMLSAMRDYYQLEALWKTDDNSHAHHWH